MEEKKDKGITVRKEENMPEWFEQVCLKAELAEFSAVKGCMVVRPNGYAIWEKIQDSFNKAIKKNGVKNCYFPLFIPERFFEMEKEHASGFNPEVAWVTHAGGSKLEERLAIRPTSEAIMSDSFKRWVRSYRDLPLKINQWCSVVRWETKATKLFLRSREFLWQEGHCLYETDEECVKETLFYLNEYKKICEELLAVPVLSGKKTEKEKFAGAKDTYAVEAFMPDGKFLQMGTSHDLGQGFVKSFDIKFVGRDEKTHHPYQNSWGLSTRIIGGLVMMHSDDKGLVLPPNIAPVQIVIVPVYKADTMKEVLKHASELKTKLSDYRVEVDDRDEYSPGWKFNEWEMKGIPLRIEIGPRDIKEKQVVLVRRDTGKKEAVKLNDVNEKVKKTLDDIQKSLFKKAEKHLKDSIVEVKDFKEFQKAIKDKKIVYAKFCGEAECEGMIKDKTDGANSRVIPSDKKLLTGECVQCGKPAKHMVYFGKSY